MLLKLLYPLLQELKLVLHYAIVVLLVLTISQGIVLKVGGRDVVSGSWRSLRYRRSMTLFFLFSLSGVVL